MTTTPSYQLHELEAAPQQGYSSYLPAPSSPNSSASDEMAFPSKAEQLSRQFSLDGGFVSTELSSPWSASSSFRPGLTSPSSQSTGALEEESQPSAVVKSENSTQPPDQRRQSSCPVRGQWTPSDDRRLRDAVYLHIHANHRELRHGYQHRSNRSRISNIKSWSKVAAAAFPDGKFSKVACQSRWRILDARPLSKGNWSAEESETLRVLVEQMGDDNWNEVAERLGTRNAKQCRERWRNKLDPSIKRTNFTPEEDEKILALFRQIGSRWSEMAKLLPGRPDNGIKNHFNSVLYKRLSSNEVQLHRLNRKQIMPSPSIQPVSGASTSQPTPSGIVSPYTPPDGSVPPSAWDKSVHMTRSNTVVCPPTFQSPSQSQAHPQSAGASTSHLELPNPVHDVNYFGQVEQPYGLVAGYAPSLSPSASPLASTTGLPPQTVPFFGGDAEPMPNFNGGMGVSAWQPQLSMNQAFDDPNSQVADLQANNWFLPNFPTDSDGTPFVPANQEGKAFGDAPLPDMFWSTPYDPVAKQQELFLSQDNLALDASLMSLHPGDINDFLGSQPGL